MKLFWKKVGRVYVSPATFHSMEFQSMSLDEGNSNATYDSEIRHTEQKSLYPYTLYLIPYTLYPYPNKKNLLPLLF